MSVGICFNFCQKSFDRHITVIRRNRFLKFVFSSVENSSDQEDRKCLVAFIMGSILGHINFERSNCFVGVESLSRYINKCNLSSVSRCCRNELWIDDVNEVKSHKEKYTHMNNVACNMKINGW
jgi:hypothetical protein